MAMGKNTNDVYYQCAYCDYLQKEKFVKCPDCKRKKIVQRSSNIEADISRLSIEDLSGFIFDPDQIVQERVFTSHLLDDSTFAFGILLPKTENITDKKGNVVNQDQVWRPVIITSDKKGIPVTKQVEIIHKIKYGEIPAEMSLRWELGSIHSWINNDIPDIDSKELFLKIRKQYEYYAYYRDNEWYDVNTLWDMGTYLHQVFSSFPIKEERGLSGTGKSKTMVISCLMSLNGTDIMINPSESTLFRITESMRSTKYIDEAEKLFKITAKGVESDNRVELINASYVSNGVVPRQEKLGDKFITKWYHVYSPTRIGSINGLFGATENRAITQVHTKAPKDAEKYPQGNRQIESDLNKQIWKEIRNDLYIWSLQNWDEIKEIYDNFNEADSNQRDLNGNVISINQRDLQIWKSLLTIAKYIDEKELLQKVIKFSIMLSDQKQIENISEGSIDHQLLESVSKLIPQIDDKIYIELIHKKLDELYPVDFKNPTMPRKPGYNKTITTRLDKLGFGTLKKRDKIGMYYELCKSTFDEIITPITNEFATFPTFATSPDINILSKYEESMKNDVEYNNINIIHYSTSDVESKKDILRYKNVANERKVEFSQGIRETKALESKGNNGHKNKDPELLIKIMEYLTKLTDNPKVPFQDLCTSFNKTPDEILDAIKILESQGEVYVPRKDHVKLILKEDPPEA